MKHEHLTIDITRQLTSRLDINFLLQTTGIGIWEIDPVTTQVLCDQKCQNLLEITHNSSIQINEAFQFLHADDAITLAEIIQLAIRDQTIGRLDHVFRVISATGAVLRHVHFWGQDCLTPAGDIDRFSGFAQEVQQSISGKQDVTASQDQLNSIINQTPAATLVLHGDNYLIAHINEAMLRFMGRGIEVVGKPLLAIMPELEGQFAWQQVQQVYREGISVDYNDVLVAHNRNGETENIYYDISYRPLLEEGKIVGMIQVAIDVTEQFLSRQKIREHQIVLESIINLAELGSYSIDLTTNQIRKSSRVAEWYGLDELNAVSVSFEAIIESDRERVRHVLQTSLEANDSGSFQVEYTVIGQKNGIKRVLRTNGQVMRNAAGEPIRVEGAVLDITTQRQQLLSLEDLVRLRTQELANLNNVLELSNEQYIILNQELSETNDLLVRSNENLLQFAYVASHDLQEPLRKIQQFADLLDKGPAISESFRSTHLQRIRHAATRMSILINDLLEFSRISTKRETTIQVDLNNVLDQVLNTLDLSISETETIIRIGSLPVILGDPSQLHQLFQNLISNSIKFRRLDTAPVISIDSLLIQFGQLPLSIKPSRASKNWQQINVTDNGIGFDAIYSERIFQVFQRLHSKAEYAGTGIGLAICEKVVANHGGAITAISSEGNGATFSIYFPA